MSVFQIIDNPIEIDRDGDVEMGMSKTTDQPLDEIGWLNVCSVRFPNIEFDNDTLKRYDLLSYQRLFNYFEMSELMWFNKSFEPTVIVLPEKSESQLSFILPIGISERYAVVARSSFNKEKYKHYKAKRKLFYLWYIQTDFTNEKPLWQHDHTHYIENLRESRLYKDFVFIITESNKTLLSTLYQITQNGLKLIMSFNIPSVPNCILANDKVALYGYNEGLQAVSATNGWNKPILLSKQSITSLDFMDDMVVCGSTDGSTHFLQFERFNVRTLKNVQSITMNLWESNEDEMKDNTTPSFTFCKFSKKYKGMQIIQNNGKELAIHRNSELEKIDNVDLLCTLENDIISTSVLSNVIFVHDADNQIHIVNCSDGKEMVNIKLTDLVSKKEKSDIYNLVEMIDNCKPQFQYESTSVIGNRQKIGILYQNGTVVFFSLNKK